MIIRELLEIFTPAFLKSKLTSLGTSWYKKPANFAIFNAHNVMGNWARDNSKRIFHRGKKPMDGPSSSKNKIVSSSSNHDQPHREECCWLCMRYLNIFSVEKFSQYWLLFTAKSKHVNGKCKWLIKLYNFLIKILAAVLLSGLNIMILHNKWMIYILWQLLW